MRPYDVILFGATGFTGTLTAHALASRAAVAPLRWAIAGRDRGKLDAVLAAVVARQPGIEPPGVVIARSHDAAELAQMVAQTRVIASTVGPFDVHGDGLVEACVDGGTDYVDITGEPAFWQRMIARHHDTARERGVLIVPCCGFDSIPHDLGAYFTAAQLPGNGPLEIEAYVRARGEPSGGTWASAINAMANLRKSAGSGDGSARGGPRPRIHHADAVGQWVVPMPTVDPLVVRRSARFCPTFGESLRYHHYLQVRSLPALVKLLAGVGIVAALAQTGPTRALLLKWRGSGEGPSDEVRARSECVVTFVGRRGGDSVRVEVAGHDPGYGLTAMMLSESALVLAEDRERLPHRGGVLTPASALGEPLLERVKRGGLSVRVV